MTETKTDFGTCPRLLEVSNLSTSFSVGTKQLRAVDDVSFHVNEGEVLGIVGESGSGKSITLRSIIGLSRRYGQVSGEVNWQGNNLVTMPERDLRKIRGKDIAMIFQEPMSSLNPLLTVGLQIGENLTEHTDLDKRGRKNRAVELLEMVGIPDAVNRLNDYPHQFSGGMRQRVMIAIALASNPKLLLADEPTTALDVTIQKQILKLILDLSKDLGMAVILVTHDLGVAAQTCDRLAVMYGGKLVETGNTREVLRAPQHRYTMGLLKSVPENIEPRTQLYSLPGTPPSLLNLPLGCAFAPRCAHAVDECSRAKPPLVGDAHQVACFNPVNQGQTPIGAA
ncbi:ABC transporter ATP-binding protein [uncultured Maritalea sp.]|jgi:oligopeptide/dipeptide ABC transporter ATP-binding protein|uniref:ABC transporter ATP-binding protein n=1 Tax=uncultured Maritalea sp. TaxID=757249 RepID=UPI00260DCCC6|nr:ABC transporter ATP-binding protein [uncultured Maritalea sp.]